MRIKTKNLNSFLNKDGKSKAKPSSMHIKAKFLNVTLSLTNFSIWFLTFYLIAPMSPSAADEQPSPEQLDPTSLLMPYMTILSPNDINTTTIPIKITEPQHKIQMQPQIIDAPAINFGAQIDKELSQDSLPIIDSQSSFLRRQLWQADITIAKAPYNTTAKNKLQNIIDQIRSVKFELKSKIPQSFIAVEPVQQAEPNEILSVTETPHQTEQKKLTRQNQIKPYMPYNPITNKTLQIIENIPQHPEQLNNFFDLAEVLFHSGQYKEAVTCYQQALTHISPDETGSSENRPWILFQIANCLRNDDPPTAAKIYRQLIAEYPQSLWADFANAQEQLILLYQQDNPKKMIEENQP